MSSRKNRAGRAVVFALGLSLCVLSAADLSHAVDAPKAPPPETAGHRFKNIQVLKDLPADQLLPTMRGFSEALGVRCGFCHVSKPDHTGFELDDKPTKRTARKMILMVQDINKRETVIHGQATCYMGHHGNEEPQLAPPPRGERPETPQPPSGAAPATPAPTPATPSGA
jgi:hypothetical protein